MPKQNVVSISGADLPAPGTVSEKLVEALTDLLERARAGEIVGIVGAVTYPSVAGYALPATDVAGGYTDSIAAVGALEDAKFQMLQRINS